MNFPDLLADYGRHRTALEIVHPGASNPSSVALALRTACRQAIAQGQSQRNNPAIRLIGFQLASLLNVDRILNGVKFGRRVEQCQLGAAERVSATL